jgi:hypothetical protein
MPVRQSKKRRYLRCQDLTDNVVQKKGEEDGMEMGRAVKMVVESNKTVMK